jgi:signal transduction histidine kinase
MIFKPIIEVQLSRLDYMIEDKNLKLTIIINHDNPVLADESNMITVLENLITNAVYYAPDDSTITILYNGIFRISNMCPELSDHDLQHLWDRFYRVDPSRSRHLGGSGLGLAIVKSILDKHGFDYGVTYEQGRIEFYFDVIHPHSTSSSILTGQL